MACDKEVEHFNCVQLHYCHHRCSKIFSSSLLAHLALFPLLAPCAIKTSSGIQVHCGGLWKLPYHRKGDVHRCRFFIETGHIPHSVIKSEAVKWVPPVLFHRTPFWVANKNCNKSLRSVPQGVYTVA